MKNIFKVIMILTIILVSKYSFANEPDSIHYYRPYFVENGCLAFYDPHNECATYINSARGYSEVGQPYIIPEGESITVKGVAFLGWFWLGREGIYDVIDPEFVNINIYQNDRLIKSVPYDTCFRVVENSNTSIAFHEIYFDEEIELSGNFLIGMEVLPWDVCYSYVAATLSMLIANCPGFNETELYNPQKKVDGVWSSLDSELWNLGDNTTNVHFLPIYPILASNSGIDKPNSDIVKNNTFLSPNPAKDFVEITSSFKIKTIDVVNMQGKKIFSKQCDNYMTQIDIHSLPSGSYIIKIHTDKGDTTRTIIKE